MPELTIAIEDEKLHRLQQTAAGLGVSVEEIVQLTINEYLARHEKFAEAANYVLQKNAELYRRLAR
jgi:hypothetical protein